MSTALPRTAAQRLTGAESIALAAATIPAVIIVASYTLDLLGIVLLPRLLSSVGVLCGALVLFQLRGRVAWRALQLVGLLACVAGTFTWLMWIAAPSFLPLGNGSDLTHHLLLIQYIEQHWRLVHDSEAYRFLGEMATYTPGSHLLAAFAGAWTGGGGAHALHGVVAATVALKLGFVYLIALRVVASIYGDAGWRGDGLRVPFALLAVVLAFCSQVYLLRSFVENSFIAQVVSELFAVVMWWSLTVWEAAPSRVPVASFGLAGAAAFLTWPIWIGPPSVVAAVLTLFNRQRAFAERAVRLALAAAPIAVVFVVYMAPRSGWFGMAGVAGGAPSPLASNYGSWFVVLSGLGLILAATRTQGWSTALLAVAIGLQSLVLYVVASRNGADTPYMALKMFYLLLYPQAVGAALAVAVLYRLIFSLVGGLIRMVSHTGGRYVVVAEIALAWVLLDRVGVAVAQPLKGAPRSLTIFRAPAMSEPLERAGRWARANVPSGCVEYLVVSDETAYWLHLAVLGNPRHDARSVDPDSFRPGPAMIRWLSPGGLPYAIVDTTVVRNEYETLATFDTAAVVKRAGASACP